MTEKGLRPIELPQMEETDEELMEKVGLGSGRAFKLLVERYDGRIINTVARFIGDRDAAQEIAQETFLRIYRHRTRYRKGSRFSTWIYTIALNLAKNEIRRRVRRPRHLSIDEIHENSGDSFPGFRDPAQSPHDLAEQRELEQIVQGVLAKLPPKYRAALVLRDIEGLSYEEVADVLDVPGGTVRSRINRARLLMRNRLESRMKRGDI
ncbi:MAG: sigma-70 family RNA polymerase sigma factor [Candidatus Eisenbacteria bacterium]|nr:sigma-70 family RNA polymerase sigma factor [Candidatus Eisenbacteria bacterium]